ncbi:ras guanyl-nucleotide exchange factor [Cercophora scortea]|uniref:Ras guanyl-nucleotide exchange factor n=1 Tax=Cercophora scortea TaxID=314031 RepID=A0AAE0MIN3_9PEZI|nr:ras guanyl-nucleotide exchange factor [Cercophora scortea]
MATPSPSTVRALYRSLLKELPPRPVLVTPRSPVHQRLRDNFLSSSKNAPATTTTPDAVQIAQAEQFLNYFKAQRSFTTLIERYNPGADMDEEERVRLSARRVGMNLPKEYGVGGGEGKGEGSKE